VGIGDRRGRATLRTLGRLSIAIVMAIGMYPVLQFLHCFMRLGDGRQHDDVRMRRYVPARERASRRCSLSDVGSAERDLCEARARPPSTPHGHGPWRLTDTAGTPKVMKYGVTTGGTQCDGRASSSRRAPRRHRG
jgi:hypothetical protein